ncbi:MAG: TIGR04149 family rSAM-modified RiPP [Bacteroidales bacterium]|jgi:natural product precursor|nr:TIGR04149 family rSAM-modified RiPP [Bacteroidales bacterium]
MKTLKLNTIASNNLSEVEMNHLKGGSAKCCGCSCYYAEKKGSSSNDNGNANHKDGLISPKGENEIVCSPN